MLEETARLLAKKDISALRKLASVQNEEIHCACNTNLSAFDKKLIPEDSGKNLSAVR